MRQFLPGGAGDLAGCKKKARCVRIAARQVLSLGPVGVNIAAQRPRDKNQSENKTRRTVLPPAAREFGLSGRGDVALKRLRDLFLRDSADDLLDDLAVLKYEQGRDAADVVAAGRIHRLIDVELH